MTKIMNGVWVIQPVEMDKEQQKARWERIRESIEEKRKEYGSSSRTPGS